MNGLRGGSLSPTAALGLGLVIPGAGQMYTGRRVFGVLTLAAAGGALAYALKSGPVTKEFVVNPKDPFGNPLPPFVDTRTETGRPNLVPGLAAVGAIAGATAIEAFVHARHRERQRTAVRGWSGAVRRRSRPSRHTALTASSGSTSTASPTSSSRRSAGEAGIVVSMLQSTSAAINGAYV